MVQIRVQRAYPSRIRAGAPRPTRSMTDEELLANLRFFTVDLAGPRSLPCTRLVLSGTGVASRPGSPTLLEQARTWGIEDVVLHLGGEDLAGFDPKRFAGLVDAVVVPVQAGDAQGTLARAARVTEESAAAGIQVVANMVLSPEAMPALSDAAKTLRLSGATRATFSYPFPLPDTAKQTLPPLTETLSALKLAVAEFEQGGVRVGIKGLPGCYLGALAKHIHRSSNRWYVDADHQGKQAVLFFPKVVSFTKDEACRFCNLDARCDGFFAAYLKRGGFPALEPVLPDVPH